MATLEKIRKKSVVLLIVIGVALIAFIIGDFLNSGRNIFGSGTTVAKVDGEKIDYMEFQQRYSQATENNQQASQLDPALMQSQLLEQMIGEVLLNEEYDALGIDVSDKELSDFLFKQAIRMDQNFGQQLNYLAQQLQAPIEMKDPSKPEQFVQDFHTFIFNPSKFGSQENEAILQARAWWLNVEKDATDRLKQMKLFRLLSGTITANDLDRAALKDELTNSYEVNMVAIPYMTLDDKDYEVTDEEIKAAYNDEKERFALTQEVRKAHYIVVPVAPSDADNAAADKFLAQVDSAFRSAQGVEGIRQYSELTITEREYRQKELPRNLKSFIDTVAVGSISKINRSGDNRTIYRYLSKKSEVDSVDIQFVSVAGAKAQQDSVLALLTSGKNPEEVANGSTISVSDTNTIDLVTLLAQGQITKDVKQKMLTENGFFTYDAGTNGAAFCKVTKKYSPKDIYTAATVEYKVEASKETRANLLNDLQKYVDANNNSKAFTENATKSDQHYSPQPATLTSDTPYLGMQYNYVKSSAKLIQWLFKDAKPGDVSAIQTDNDQYVVVALDAVYDGDYKPLSDSDVRSECELLARNKKKGETLVAKYAGKASDVAGYATAMERQAQTISVNSNTINRGIDAVVAGQVPYAEINKVYGPVAGDRGVFVYQVLKKETAANPVTDDQIDQNYKQQFSAFNSVIDVLRDNADIENNIVNFR